MCDIVWDYSVGHNDSSIALPCLHLCTGGAKAMEGITPDSNPQYDGVPLDPPPSMRQGFGAAHLGRSLPIASNPSGWSMQVCHNPTSPVLLFVCKVQMLDAGIYNDTCVFGAGA